ncbi:CarD family transcriptional regulator [Anaeromyxobacter sp. Fw109-5]|uniref:CarD family transcriptional regulator n=1 Tax=Anaeromyxobacter sp. (strain Fw109-5) TaxID=404589 RepID=UPI0000ED7F08|nr:CarD family transcriptional regulator [Anaeromyxobacter sp. Fw109-5]ABS26986.1 transcriptional regulator, CarD family [Anaeromyxobacter sp. Fw109-5]
MRGPPPRHPDEQREQLPAVEGVIADAAELRPGNRVVYPNQGVCEVVGVEEKDIAGQKLQLVRMRREEDGAAVLVPRNKVPSIGLRRVATGEQIEGVFHFLAAQFEDPELDWKVRHRDNADRLIAGGVLGVAEVVKGLHSLSRIRPLPAKEREQYDNARHLLVHEVAVSLGVPPALAEDYIDYALMPPAGVKFDLKPPPTPVLLPSRPKRRRPAAAEEEGIEDLGLGELGLGELELGEALEGVPEVGEAAEPGAEAEGAEGAPAEEGAEAAPEEAEAEEEAAAPARKARKAAAPRAEKREAKPASAKEPRKKPEKPEKAEKPEKPAKHARAEKKPAAKKAPAKKVEKPAKKPAAKPAAKRGGKKK